MKPTLEVTLIFTGADLELLLAMMRAGAWATPRGVVKSSLFREAVHLGLAPHHDAFGLKRGE